MKSPALRTKRKKKSRRACTHCRSAHLTCGDERPCQRCIKRGYDCIDVGKKAKKSGENISNISPQPPVSPTFYDQFSCNDPLYTMPQATNDTQNLNRGALFDPFDATIFNSNFDCHGMPEFSGTENKSVSSQGMGAWSFNAVSDAENEFQLAEQQRVRANKAIDAEIERLRSQPFLTTPIIGIPHLADMAEGNGYPTISVPTLVCETNPRSNHYDYFQANQETGSRHFC